MCGLPFLVSSEDRALPATCSVKALKINCTPTSSAARKKAPEKPPGLLFLSSRRAGLTRLRGRSPFGAAKARASIKKESFLSMDCRVKPGNDE
jgi:hypothetical protein